MKPFVALCAIGVLTFMSKDLRVLVVWWITLTPIVLQVLSIASLKPLMYGRHRRGTLSICVPICCGLSLSDPRFNIPLVRLSGYPLNLKPLSSIFFLSG